MARVSEIEVHQCCLTDAGREPSKQVNEDAGRAERTPRGHLALVCDGMGGHAHGRAASQAAINTIFSELAQAAPGEPPGQALVRAIEAANYAVYQQGGGPEVEARPGSTCVAVLVHDNGAEFAHVGDSRAYLIRGGQIYRMTRDHSVVQQMVDAGMLSEEQAAEHPDSNRITRALGMAPNVDVELRPGPFALCPGDVFLLASDGLTDLVQDTEILSIFSNRSQESLETACQALIDMANLRGGHDNITALLMQIRSLPTTAPDVPVPAPFTGPKTVVDRQSPSTQVGGGTHPTLASAVHLEAGPPGPPPPAGATPTRTDTEPGLQSPFHETTPTTGRFVSDYPGRISTMSRGGKIMLGLAAIFTVIIVGAIVLWWIVAALSHAPSAP